MNAAGERFVLSFLCFLEECSRSRKARRDEFDSRRDDRDRGGRQWNRGDDRRRGESRGGRNWNERDRPQRVLYSFFELALLSDVLNLNFFRKFYDFDI